MIAMTPVEVWPIPAQAREQRHQRAHPEFVGIVPSPPMGMGMGSLQTRTGEPLPSR